VALDINDLNPEFARRMALAIRDARASGVTGITLNSAFRSVADQARIRAEHEAMPGGVVAHPAAPAGASYHNYGFATDMSGPQVQKFREFVLVHPEYGIEAPVRNDPYHFQFGGSNLAALKQSAPALESGVDIDEVRKYLANFGAGQETTPGLAPPPPSAYGVTSTPPAPTGSAIGPNLGTTITTTPNTGTTPATTVATPPAAPADQPSIASLLGKGDIKGALNSPGNDLISGGINQLTKGMSQQHDAPKPLDIPALQDNSAAIASQAPQMMAALMAQIRARQQGPQQQQIPGLSLMNKRQYF
jgi:hypothetical protein